MENPKQAPGRKKYSMAPLPAAVMAEVGTAMLEGALKYGRHNWRDTGIVASDYYDATLRHLFAWWEGEDIDRDSGLSHVTKAIASLVVLRDAMAMGTVVDDRPVRLGGKWQDGLNALVDGLREKYPEPRAPHCEAGRRRAMGVEELSDEELEELGR